MNIANLLAANMVTADSGLHSVKGEKMAEGDFVSMLMNMMNGDAEIANDAANSKSIVMRILQMLSNGADSEECLSLVDGADIEVLEEVANLIGAIAGIRREEGITNAKLEEDTDKVAASDDELIEEMQALVSVPMPAQIPDTENVIMEDSGMDRYLAINADVATYQNVDAGQKAYDVEQLPQGIDVSEFANLVDGETFEEVSIAMNRALDVAIAQRAATEAVNHVSNGAESGTGGGSSADNAISEESNIEITKIVQDKSAQILERSVSELRPVVVQSEEIAELQKVHRTKNADGVQSIGAIANPEMSNIDEVAQAEVIIKEPIQQVANRINNQIMALEKEGTTKIEMKLEPESLGRVVIEMTLESGKLAVKIVAENQMASAMLAERASDLTHGLKGQGITLESYDISYSNQHKDNSFTQRDQHFSRSKSAFAMHGDFSGEVDNDFANSPSSALNLYV